MDLSNYKNLIVDPNGLLMGVRYPVLIGPLVGSQSRVFNVASIRNDANNSMFSPLYLIVHDGTGAATIGSTILNGIYPVKLPTKFGTTFPLLSSGDFSLSVNDITSTVNGTMYFEFTNFPYNPQLYGNFVA